MRQLERNYKRIVVKIGSSLFFRRLIPIGINLDFNVINGIAEQIMQLVKVGKEIVIVSSGAIAMGMTLLKIARPKELSYLQAIAAIGQNELMYVYRKIFNKETLNCAQVLLTWEDFDNRKRYLNAKNTLIKLLELGTVPIVNENDTVSTDEIKFGDNDRLSALVATLINAELLIILSDIDGLLDKDKKVIRVVEKITPQIRALAYSTDKKTSVGGMITKIEAARITTDSGIPCVIANGLHRDIISKLIYKPEDNGTLFIPKKGYLTARERWLAFGAKPKGRIIIDDGARNALLNNKSLLSVGVAGLSGNFEAGDIVSVVDKQNSEFARGKVGLSSRQLDKVKGSRFDKEVIHRDNIAIL